MTKTGRPLLDRRQLAHAPVGFIASSGRVIASGRNRLRPRARLIRTIGAELISSEVVAVLELVRNGYDADATLVQVIFEDPHLPDAAVLEIRDDGHGMSRDVVLGAWLEPATAFKTADSTSTRGGDRSPLGRRRLGSKGVGRFASHRLGTHLLVRSSLGKRSEMRAEFDWVQLDRSDSYLDQVSVPWKEVRNSSHRTWRGTSLLMRGLRDHWTEDRFQRLRLSLSRLLGPGLGSSPPFRIELVVNGAVERIKPALETLPPMYSVKGKVKTSGNALMTYRDHIGASEQWERSVPWPPAGLTCGPFTFEVKAWDLDKPALMPFLAKTGTPHGLRDFRRLIREHSGISLYRDGFRILPYGEPDNDWLRLDRRRVNNPTVRFSNNQILGWVNISSENNQELRDQTNREGLVNNGAYVHLQQVLLELLTHFEGRRFGARRASGTGVVAPLRRASHRPLFEGGADAQIQVSPDFATLAAQGYLAGLLRQYVEHSHRQVATELDLLRSELPTLWGGVELHTAILPAVARAQQRLRSIPEPWFPSKEYESVLGGAPATPLVRVGRILALHAERIVRAGVVVAIGQPAAATMVEPGSPFDCILALVLSALLDVLEGAAAPRQLAIEVSGMNLTISATAEGPEGPVSSVALEASTGWRLVGQLAPGGVEANDSPDGLCIRLHLG